jgi:hypothetical protein
MAFGLLSSVTRALTKFSDPSSSANFRAKDKNNDIFSVNLNYRGGQTITLMTFQLR